MWEFFCYVGAFLLCGSFFMWEFFFVMWELFCYVGAFLLCGSFFFVKWELFCYVGASPRVRDTSLITSCTREPIGKTLARKTNYLCN